MALYPKMKLIAIILNRKVINLRYPLQIQSILA